MTSRFKGVVLLASAAAVYVLAAWAVAPGFYDCCAPPQAYNWSCPPPGTPPGNQLPLSGSRDIKVTKGISDPDSAFTTDGQLAIGFLPGAFDATGLSTISVEIKPVMPCPNPAGIHFATNAYAITSTAPLVKDANLVLSYSAIVPAPSDVYFAPNTDGPWRSIGSAATAQPFTIDTTTRKFGYFAAGYASNATTQTRASQLLPIVAAVLIVAVLVAGIPLAILRRRHSEGDSWDADGEGDA